MAEPVCKMAQDGEREKVYLSIQEAARVLGVSERSVYGYVEHGKLSRVCIDGLIMLLAAEVATFVRKAPGRTRTISPRWRVCPEHNPLDLTTILVDVRPGCKTLLEEICEAFRVSGKHHLVGTSARFVARLNQCDPGKVAILLFWRGAALPPDEQRKQALAAFYADLSSVLDWSTVLVTEGEVVLHAG